jgi:hypothetical protein
LDASAAVTRDAGEHRRPHSLFLGRLLEHVPTLGKTPIFDSDDIGRDERRGQASWARKNAPTSVRRSCRLTEYAVVNASIVQKLDLGIGLGTELRLDVLNIGDAVYEIRNGTGVGVGAPQFGIRRAILAGLTQRF